MNKQRILLMYANEFDMKADDGRPLKGCILNYFFFGENGELLKAQHDQVGNVGFQRAKSNVDYDMRKQVYCAPGIYDAEFEMSVGSDGKPVLKVSDLYFVGGVDFNLIPKDQAKK